MLNNESAQNPTKPTPLCPSHLPNFVHIFTSSNGLRMQKISRFVRKPKQAKKGDDCTVRTVPRGRLTVQAIHGHTDDVAASGDDMWQVMWCTIDSWTNLWVTHVTTIRVTHGRG
jgi:hypothetical protein